MRELCFLHELQDSSQSLVTILKKKIPSPMLQSCLQRLCTGCRCFGQSPIFCAARHMKRRVRLQSCSASCPGSCSSAVRSCLRSRTSCWKLRCSCPPQVLSWVMYYQGQGAAISLSLVGLVCRVQDQCLFKLLRACECLYSLAQAFKPLCLCPGY